MLRNRDKRIKSWGVCVPFLFFFTTSCWSPVFNEKAALAAVSASKLTLETEFKADLNVYGLQTKVVAYPSLERPPTAVVIASLTPIEYRLSLYLRSGEFYSGQATGSNDSNYKYALGDPEETTVKMGGGSGNSVRYAVYVPSIGSGSVYYYNGSTFNPTFSLYTPTPSNFIFGIGPSYITPGATPGNAFGLVYVSNATNVDFASDGGIPMFSPASAPSVTLSRTKPASFSNGWAAQDNSNRIYLTPAQKSNGQYTTYRIDATSNAINWTRSDRVVAWLNGTNELLTKDAYFYFVCDSSGAVKYSFPGGNLYFTSEFWDNAESAYYCQFTTATPVEGESSSQYTVRVYSIRTNELTRLK